MVDLGYHRRCDCGRSGSARCCDEEKDVDVITCTVKSIYLVQSFGMKCAYKRFHLCDSCIV